MISVGKFLFNLLHFSSYIFSFIGIVNLISNKKRVLSCKLTEKNKTREQTLTIFFYLEISDSGRYCVAPKKYKISKTIHFG